MKRLLSLVLILLLLCGCAAPRPDVTETTHAPTEPTTVQEPFGYYLPGSALEKQTGGALRAYPLNSRVSLGMFPLEDDLLLITGSNYDGAYSYDDSYEYANDAGPVVLERLTGDNLYVSASLTLPELHSAGPNSVSTGPRGVTVYNDETLEIVFLDENLRELRRTELPGEIVGFPAVSPDWATVYYCTDSGIRALDLESGLDRVLKESYESYKSVERLLMDGTILQCSLSDMEYTTTVFLSAETGMTLYEADGYLNMESDGGRYYAYLYNDTWDAYLFGTRDGQPSVVNPVDYLSSVSFVPNRNGAVSKLSDRGDTQLDYYDLNTGTRTASLRLSQDFYPWRYVQNSKNQLYCLLYDDTYQSDTIYRWDLDRSAVTDSDVYTGAYYTLDHPDYAGLDQCQRKADEIGSRHGLKIRLWQDAVERSPWDYEFAPEYLVPILNQELEHIDRYLSYYPETILNQLEKRYASLELCLVRGIYGSQDFGSLESANGLQYWLDSAPCIALVSGFDFESTLYHELFHVMDSQILTLSNAYDNWERLNPQGFFYDYDYVSNTTRDGSQYLIPGQEAFIDTYSMSFPTEDRARIMENAMLDNNESRFESPTMQAKLRQLCIGIREGFGLTKSREMFRWEQYLKEPLAYK